MLNTIFSGLPASCEGSWQTHEVASGQLQYAELANSLLSPFARINTQLPTKIMAASAETERNTRNVHLKVERSHRCGWFATVTLAFFQLSTLPRTCRRHQLWRSWPSKAQSMCCLAVDYGTGTIYSHLCNRWCGTSINSLCQDWNIIPHRSLQEFPWNQQLQLWHVLFNLWDGRFHTALKSSQESTSQGSNRCENCWKVELQEVGAVVQLFDAIHSSVSLLGIVSN